MYKVFSIYDIRNKKIGYYYSEIYNKKGIRVYDCQLFTKKGELYKSYKQNGIDNFIIETIKEFDSVIEAVDYLSTILTEEVLNSENTYNRLSARVTNQDFQKYLEYYKIECIDGKLFRDGIEIKSQFEFTHQCNKLKRANPACYKRICEYFNIKPVIRQTNKKRKISTPFGEFESTKELERKINMNSGSVTYRLNSDNFSDWKRI